MNNRFLLTVNLFFFLCLKIGAQHQVPIPSPAQLQWQNAELAALVCWDMHVFDDIEVTRMRLVIKSAIGTPKIKKMEVHKN